VRGVDPPPSALNGTPAGWPRRAHRPPEAGEDAGDLAQTAPTSLAPRPFDRRHDLATAPLVLVVASQGVEFALEPKDRIIRTGPTHSDD
jgi:hypothetical protein